MVIWWGILSIKENDKQAQIYEKLNCTCQFIVICVETCKTRTKILRIQIVESAYFNLTFF